MTGPERPTEEGGSPQPEPDRLATLEWGAGPTLVLVHGFTQNAACWGPFGTALGRGRRVVAVDLPGHGGSSALDADLRRSAELLGDTGGRADYLGYSLGGRVALHLALSRPELVRRLVLVGATGGLRGAEARRARLLADGRLADELDPPGTVRSPKEAQAVLDAFLARWLAGPLFEALTPEAACLEARRTNSPAGLAASLRACGTGTQEPLWNRLAELDMPVLAAAGELDDRFSAEAAALAGAIGANAGHALVAGAGHACHLERPEETAALVEAFLAGPEADSGPRLAGP